MDEDANAAAKRMAQLDAANALKMKADLDATASINKLAEAAKLAAFGIGNMTLGGVPAAQFMATAIGPDGIGNEALARAVEIESQLALMDALNAVEQARGSVGYSDTTNNFTINTPLGTEDALTEAMQRALQNLNRYGASTTFAGAIPTP
jgi:hypothetical protein